MRVTTPILGGLLCALAVLLLTRGWWTPPGEDGLRPLQAPIDGAGDRDGLAGQVMPDGEANGAGEGDGLSRMTASRLPGRCVLYLGDEGIPGVQLEFLDQGERLAAVRSDQNGEFIAELGRHAVSLVEVNPPPEFWVVEHELERDRYLVRLAPFDVGPLRARLVDRLTGEPVPEYAVQVRDEEEWAETVRTDAQGIFQTEVLLKEGQVILSATEEETTEFFVDWRLASHQHRPSGATPPLAVIAISVGPTYRLLLEKPDDLPLARLRAFLIPLDWVEEVLDDLDLSGEVRAGDPPWVRFVQDGAWIEDARLVVTDANGRWRGVAAVDPSPGVHLDPVPIRLERMARVNGKVLDSKGEGVSRADVQLRSVEASNSALPRLAISNGLGNFVFEGVPAGTYEITVRHATRGASEGMIHVLPETAELHRFQLEPYIVAGDISGVVRSTTGSFRGAVSLRLEFEQDEGEEYVPSRYVRVSWQEEGGEYVGRFRFVAVAEGRCLLHAGLRGVPHEVTPPRLEVEAPMSDLDFVVEDDHEVWRLGLHAVDAADGRWIAEARLRVTDGAGGVVYDGRPQGWMPQRKWGEDETLLWEVRAPGYMTQRGDRSAFVWGLGAGRRTAVVRLRRD